MKAISSEELSYQYIPWYVRDYLEDVECDVLSAAAEGCRLRLVLRQWLQGSIPANPAVLRKLTKATEAEWVTVWPEIEHHFPVIEDGAARRNPKFHALRLDREVFLEGKRQLGAKGGKARAAKYGRGQQDLQHSHSDGQAGAIPDGTANAQAHGIAPAIPDGRANAKAPAIAPGTADAQAHGEASAIANGVATPVAELKHGPSLELLAVAVAIPPSPTPDGVGASPTPPVRLVQDADRESPADRAAAYNTSLDEAVRRLPAGPLRAAVRRLLDEARIAPAKWEGWADRILGWEQGLGTSRMREVPREAIVLGLEELLLSNQPGQFITPQIALIFAEKARARMSEGEGPSGAGRGAHPPRTSGPTAKESQLRDAIEYARNGDEAARAWCTENAVDWEVAS